MLLYSRNRKSHDSIRVRYSGAIFSIQVLFLLLLPMFFVNRKEDGQGERISNKEIANGSNRVINK